MSKDPTELGFDVLEASASELAHLMRHCPRGITHTWPGSKPHGLLWRKCPWVIPVICDLRKVAITDELRAAFDSREAEH